MATKKDLVEAHAFSRRRLVTAFVSGAPGGREVEPVRPGRVLIGGIALSVLLMAGAAIAGFLLGRPPAQWLDAKSFIISKDTGEQYVVLRGGDDPVIQRVPNYVSAQLLLGEADLTPSTVRDKYIRTVRLGEDLGIDAAPASLPTADELVDDGWTACTAPDTGIKLAVQQERTVEDLTDSAFLVTSGRQLWLIATAPAVGSEQGRAYRFEMPRDEVSASTIADELDFGASAAAPKVPEEWLNLFPLGPPLAQDEFGVTRSGEQVDYVEASTGLTRYRVGDLVQSSAGDYYLLGDDGVQPLDPFAGMVYDAVGSRAVQLDGDVRAGLDTPDYPTEWPSAFPSPVLSGALCGVLHPGDGEAASVSLATNPTGDADPAGIGASNHDVDVEPSSGAYVLSGSGEAADDGTPFVIDTKGARYELVGASVPDYIGYGSVDPPLVPSAWLGFFEPGVSLSTNKARRVPEDAPSADSDAADSADEAGGS